jgi:hypothetical protein
MARATASVAQDYRAKKIAPYMLKRFEGLVAFLKRQSIQRRLIPDEQKVISPIRMKPLESETAILRAHNRSLVQHVHPFSFEVHEERIPGRGSAIMLLGDRSLNYGAESGY